MQRGSSPQDLKIQFCIRVQECGERDRQRGGEKRDYREKIIREVDSWLWRLRHPPSAVCRPEALGLPTSCCWSTSKGSRNLCGHRCRFCNSKTREWVLRSGLWEWQEKDWPGFPCFSSVPLLRGELHSQTCMPSSLGTLSQTDPQAVLCQFCSQGDTYNIHHKYCLSQNPAVLL